MGNITKKHTLNIKAVLTVEDTTVYVQTEDMDEAVSMSEFVKDFDGREVNITVAEKIDLD